MISPTPRAILLMFIGVPVFLAISIFAPQLWIAAAGWISGILGLLLLDVLLAARLDALQIVINPPVQLYIDDTEEVAVELLFGTGSLPGWIDVRLETSDILHQPEVTRLTRLRTGGNICTIELTPKRRGAAELTWLWVRWVGPLGLAQKRRRDSLDVEIQVVPNIKWVREQAIRLYTRDAEYGIKMQQDRGDGSEFDAMREFSAGMDRRSIDWKHSARHRTLLAKEFRTERNHNIIFAFDTGRLMSEPLNGIPKIDRAVNAGLLLAFVSLKSGDRTGVFGFDAQPRLASSLLSGRGAFTHVQSLASQINYSTEEANYTLALTELSGRLERRSLIILFTDFVDTISAELMLETVKRLTDRHLVVFATFQDAALSKFVEKTPIEGEDVSRAVIAGTLLKERELVFRRLERMGAQVLETTPQDFGSELLSRYFEIKRRELL